ncbi:bifunctional dTDP-4-dehydrorhamnose 3,5-epimerase family protein/NAD(P)-dependent oxidoreductase [Aeromicrobium sp. 9AM]|uniref:sugar nucleotide-binding protein n=1 Tax=Aeromicrobium sp. 9AM TaxID=2653126 RepID=UPI0012F326AE|nr:bifunctional dTDP-4-dehydrorhamnose 3,5-epimerase family protein/NAD(P)-dependent oxidoreductase [Aeromicrobium sp. 9AM]VXA97909.1 dTDP-4-dehydrorhamnose reductase [Aeromicrobium sp. 9AM]
MSESPQAGTTPIPGLLVIRVAVHEDARGWFKENWQRSKMIDAGLPDFGPVQHNVAFNTSAGTTRGIHAEPWDKLVSVATGRVFGAWVDLRAGESFGAVHTAELDPATAVYVPRGVANSYQTLEDGTAYSYLVNAHWSPDAEYANLNLADETVNIAWPLPLVEISDKDRDHPRLADVVPVPPRRTVILGADGQLGRALREALPDALALTRAELDLADPTTYDRVRWDDVDTIINAAAFTAVDAAETPDGRREAWAVNVTGVAALARLAIQHRLTLVTVSSDYVFDGTQAEHAIDEPVSPLGVYGQTKAAGEAVTSTVPQHYVVRTSWVVGDGGNFVATMQRLARDGVRPQVVDDQFGRLTTARELADGILGLLSSGAPYGIHHITGGGEPRSWAHIAREVFVAEGRSADDVIGVSTESYGADKQLAPRPRHSSLAPRAD